jgi:hypothetical protein
MEYEVSSCSLSPQSSLSSLRSSSDDLLLADEIYTHVTYSTLIDRNIDPESDQLPDTSPLLVRQAAFVCVTRDSAAVC